MTGSSFWTGKNVFLTGYTGFKGSWMCKVLSMLGANVTGYALAPDSPANLFQLSDISNLVSGVFDDIRDLGSLTNAMVNSHPEIVFHLAAQPIVKEGYSNPVYTYETNVMGTVNVLEAIRNCPSVRSFVNVTTDKVYFNNEWAWGYRETDSLDGYDPYANSKSCSELVTRSYKRSFLDKVAVSACRSGNVIGGGDFADNRIIPDCVRTAIEGKIISVRNPHSVRPYQHVLEPVFAYLLVAQKQYEDSGCQGEYNIGPNNSDCVTTAELANIFCEEWGDGLAWSNLCESNAPHEANILRLDCSKISNQLGWKPKWDVRQAIKETVEWSKRYNKGLDVVSIMENQINKYIQE